MRSSIPSQEQFPNVLDARNFGNAWKMYMHIREIENQFNSLQSTYRTLASTWLLATFAGVGFVLTETIDWIFPEPLIIALIGLAGGVGIWLLWLIDIMVYQHLLFAAFQSGVRLEERYSWLPPIRLTMKETQIGGAVRFRVVWYYIVGTSMPLLISLVSFTSWLYEIERGKAVDDMLTPGVPIVPAIFVAAVGVLVIALVGRHIYAASTRDI